MRANSISVVRQLIKAGANLNSKNQNGMTPLMFSVNENNLNIVKELIKANANSRRSSSRDRARWRTAR